MMTAEEASRRFAGLCVSGPAVFESDAGILLADEVLRALAGGNAFDLVEHHTVTQISDVGAEVTIDAMGYGQRRTFSCKAAVLCGGRVVIEACQNRGVVLSRRRSLVEFAASDLREHSRREG